MQKHLRKLPSIEIATEKYSPEEYQRFNNQFEISDISMISCNVEKKEEFGLDYIESKAEIKSEISIYENFVANNPEIYKRFEFTLQNSEFVILSIDVEWKIDCIATEGMFDEYLAVIFNEFNLNRIMTPYLREFVNSMTARMGIPPITLPLLKT